MKWNGRKVHEVLLGLENQFINEKGQSESAFENEVASSPSDCSLSWLMIEWTEFCCNEVVVMRGFG